MTIGQGATETIAKNQREKKGIKNTGCGLFGAVDMIIDITKMKPTIIKNLSGSMSKSIKRRLIILRRNNGKVL